MGARRTMASVQVVLTAPPPAPGTWCLRAWRGRTQVPSVIAKAPRRPHLSVQVCVACGWQGVVVSGQRSHLEGRSCGQKLGTQALGSDRRTAAQRAALCGDSFRLATVTTGQHAGVLVCGQG